MTDRATHPTGEHQPDVTVNDDTKVNLSTVKWVVGVIVVGIMAFGALQAQVNAQETRITGLERIMCAVAKKMDVLVAECSSGN